MQHFKVLVLDDSPHVIEWVERRIRGAQALGQLDPALPVEVMAIQVKLEPSSEDNARWEFSSDTARSLAAACEKPPDLVLVDYGFVDPAIVAQLQQEARTREITGEELKGKVLTAYDLARWCQEDAPLDARTRLRIRKNLFEAGRPVYLYSYPSRELRRAAGNMDERAKKIRDAFPRSRVSVIDARRELYNEDDFDSPGTSKYDSRFYAYQIAVVLDYVVQKEILRLLLGRSRFLRVRRTAGAVASLAAIGSALGVGGHWVGGLTYELFSHGQLLQAFGLAFGVLLSLFLFGFAASLFFERAMEHLLIKDEEVGN
jgi:CheY-like chemotaxis protein